MMTYFEMAGVEAGYHSIILNKGLSSEYIFPRNFSMDEPPWSKRLNELERAYKHGSVITGDEMVKARSLRVWGCLNYATREAFRTALDAMTSACYRPDMTLHATWHWIDRYMPVDSIADFAVSYLVTLHSADIDTLFRITDPFWYSDYKSQSSQNGLSTGLLPSLIYNRGQIEVSPTIHIRVATGTVTKVVMRNYSDDDRLFTYERSLVAPRGFRIKGSTGEVHYWSGAGYAEDYESFSGSFFRLQPGSNQIGIELTGAGTVNITFYWREKWLG